MAPEGGGRAEHAHQSKEAKRLNDKRSPDTLSFILVCCECGCGDCAAALCVPQHVAMRVCLASTRCNRVHVLTLSSHGISITRPFHVAPQTCELYKKKQSACMLGERMFVCSFYRA